MSPPGRISAEEVARFHEALAELTPGPGVAQRALRRLVVAGCRLVGWRLYVDHAPVLPGDLPGAGCVVAAAPHRAWIDPFLLLAAWPPDGARLVWLADGRTVTRSWLRRWILPRLGVIPIDASSSGPRLYADLAAEVLAAGHALAIFPEVGAPSPSDRTRRISPGFAYLALRAGAPIVPVVIGGTHHIVRGSAFSIDLLAPIESGAAIAEPFDLDGRARAHALAERIETVMAELLPRRTAQARARAPKRDRWRWLATLFD